MSMEIFSKVRKSLGKLTMEYKFGFDKQKTELVHASTQSLVVESEAGRIRDTEDTFQKIKNAIFLVAEDSGLEVNEISIETSIVDDLGFTSLNFVDLKIALEDVLGIEDFSMLEWFAEENMKEGKRFTVYSLLQKIE